MYGKFASAALLGLSAVASARPTMPSSVGTATAALSTGSNGVRYSSTGYNDSGSFGGNGFPNPSKQQIGQIEKQAGGTLPGPNGDAPTGLQPDTVNSLGFIAFNELFEVKFFSELLYNITNNVHGYTASDISPADRDVVLANLKVILAQEELHELNANGGFAANSNGQKIQPCKYQFPVENFIDAIGLASKFTDVVLSTLPDIQTVAATDGDVGLVRPVGSVIGQEGEQNGFYRSLLGKVPSQLPFLTGGARNFAFNAILQNFVVDGSCPSLELLEHPAAGIPLNETGTLVVKTDISELKDITASFDLVLKEQSNTHSYYQQYKQGGLYMTYINQQNKPVSFPLTLVGFSSEAITVSARFPAETNFLNGLTIAAVTTESDFSDVEAVAAATQFGPGLIEIN